MDVKSLFEQWRVAKHDTWGLAWFLSYEFCKRFYGSHGIAPRVIDWDGIGYYGLVLERVPCAVNGPKKQQVGRFTKAGNVENWITGSQGDHGLKAQDLLAGGAPTEVLVREMISHLAIPMVPEKSHAGCRHKRWAGSFELIHEIATIVALRRTRDEVSIWNQSSRTKKLVTEMDPRATMAEHPGAYLIASEQRDARVIVTGDGRRLGAQPESYWERYMAGESAWSLALEIESRILETSAPEVTRREHE